MPSLLDAQMLVPQSLTQVLGLLEEFGAAAQVIAGGTWIMRSALRAEPVRATYVSLAGIDELHQLQCDGAWLDIGAGTTHTHLASALAAEPGLQALYLAASKSANPSVRNVATVGGNLAAQGFAAADLVPALICLDARVELVSKAGSEQLSVEQYQAQRRADGAPALVRRVLVPRVADAHTRSVHIRLPLRKAGDYPVAIVSMCVRLSPAGVVEHARVAVGSVEARARRWTSLEDRLVGARLDAQAAVAHATELASEFQGRDAVEAPGWYRVHVLPTLVGRGIWQMAQQPSDVPN